MTKQKSAKRTPPMGIRVPPELGESLETIAEGTPFTTHAVAVIALELGRRQLEAAPDLLQKTHLELLEAKKERTKNQRES